MDNPTVQHAHCLLCAQELDRDRALSLGNLPPCNAFSDPGGATHLLSLAECPRCNLIQLLDFPPPEFVRPRFSWIRYNEPTSHLTDLASKVRELLTLEQPTVMGVGPFDAPFLDSVKSWSGSTFILDMSSVLPHEPERFSYLESYQQVLRPTTLAQLAVDQAQADLVVCRYLLEHSHDPIASLQGLKHLIKAGGKLLIEIPDSSKFLHASDYSFIWEEHICYFTESSMRQLAAHAGYAIDQVFRYLGALEDALVFILSPVASPPSAMTALGPSSTFEQIRANLMPLRHRYANAIEVLHQRGKKLAIFGAGHQAIMFINALELQGNIDYVIDDAPDKLGHLVPGTSIPIVSSAILADDLQIAVCLMAVAPAIEDKISVKHAGFIDGGGGMHTIFPGAGRPLWIDSLR